MTRVVIASPINVGGYALRKGDTVEAKTALIALLGTSARATVARDLAGENVESAIRAPDQRVELDTALDL